MGVGVWSFRGLGGRNDVIKNLRGETRDIFSKL